MWPAGSKFDAQRLSLRFFRISAFCNFCLFGATLGCDSANENARLPWLNGAAHR